MKLGTTASHDASLTEGSYYHILHA